MLGRQGFQPAIGKPIELDEDQVPYFDDLRMIGIHQLISSHCLFLLLAAHVDVDLRTGTTRTGFAHLPEIVLLVSIDDALRWEKLGPKRGGFVIALQHVGAIALIYGGIEVFRIDLEFIHEKSPSPFDRLLLEVIAETPVAQHFKKRMVVGILAHLFQIVVLPAHPQALLRIRHPGAAGR